jgi:F0F1-type ATP synthase assembly protein I
MSSDPSSGSPEQPDERGHRAEPARANLPPGSPGTPDRQADRKDHNDAWAASGLLISGVVVWGGAGYLVSQWLHNQLFVMVGLLLGTGTALYAIWFRYGRS